MFAEGLFIDGFAGGGGASTGIAQAIGREVDIAINHSEAAIAIHKANHPGTEHFCQDIRSIWPAAATKLQVVVGAWFSPDCKEYSKAKGGPVKDRHIRALSNEVTNWLRETRPLVAWVENVEEYETAAPLDEDGKPIKALAGKPFKRLVRQWRGLGYRVKWKKLRACNYGAPTTRLRLYVVLRRDGQPINWPEATHGDPNSQAVRSGKLLPWLTAAQCVDWSIPVPSIFDRDRELVDATKRRLAHGVMRYVVDAERPYLVGENDNFRAPHITKFYSTGVGASMDGGFPTVTANGGSNRGGAAPLGLAEAKLAPFVTYGQHGGASRPATDPHHTIAASKKDQNCIATAELVEAPAQVAAFMSSFYGSDKRGSGGDMKRPLRTARAGGQHHALVAAHIEQANTGMIGHSPRRPISTIVGKGCTQRIVETTMVEEGALPPDMLRRATRVAAFLVKYYATNGENETSQSQAIDRPLDVITVKARFAVVTVTIDAITYVIVDIGMRMLTPRELARAQGFPEDYILDPVCWYVTEKGNRKYGRLPKSLQIAAIGNSVCPPVARALVEANRPRLNDNSPLEELRRAA